MHTRIKIWINSSIAHQRHSDFNKINTKRGDINVKNVNLVQVVSEYYDKIQLNTAEDIFQTSRTFTKYFTLSMLICLLAFLVFIIKIYTRSKKFKFLFKKTQNENKKSLVNL
jgi:hypothetical protein